MPTNKHDTGDRRLENKILWWKLAIEAYTAVFVTLVVILLLLGYGEAGR